MKGNLMSSLVQLDNETMQQLVAEVKETIAKEMDFVKEKGFVQINRFLERWKGIGNQPPKHFPEKETRFRLFKEIKSAIFLLLAGAAGFFYASLLGSHENKKGLYIFLVKPF